MDLKVMLLLFFLFGVLYLAAVLGFWSLCRMSGWQQQPWPTSPDEPMAPIPVPRERLLHRETQATGLTVHSGRPLGV